MTLSHRLYGLRVASPWALPAARDDAGVPDVVVDAAARPLVGRPGPSSREWFEHARLHDGSDYLRWRGLGEFVVSPDGGRVRCRRLGTTTPATVSTYLLGQALSFALLKRGLEPLHATAVVLDGRAVAFLGDCGGGKSTLAAAFVRQGAALLTDDLLVLELRAGVAVAHAGPRRIKLFPRVARAVLGVPARGVPMNRGTRKLVMPLAEAQVPPAAVPLAAVYVLAKRASPRARVQRLAPRPAALALVRNTFNTIVDDPARLRRLLDVASCLALTVPVRSLAFPRGLARLSAVCDAIRRDLRG